MKKHALNIFPEANEEDFNRLLEDIRNNGFDQSQPVIVYEGAILDGWNRHRACQAIGISPAIKTFDGDQSAALRLVMRTNKRRNLNKGQWATIAVEAEDVLKAIAEQVEKDRIEKQKANAVNQHREPALAQKIVPTQTKSERETATKAAEMFNTNRQLHFLTSP